MQIAGRQCPPLSKLLSLSRWIYIALLSAPFLTRHISAWFLSSSVSSNSFIASTTGIDATNYFHSADFVCAAGYGHSNALPAVYSKCSCDKLVCLSTEQSYTAHCSVNRAIWTHRHNDIRDCFGRLLRKMFPNNVLAMEKTVGKTAPDADGVANDVDADIALDLGPEVIVIDFAVGNPDASQYTEYPTESLINKNGASEYMERSKRSKYAKIAPTSVVSFKLKKNKNNYMKVKLKIIRR